MAVTRGVDTLDCDLFYAIGAEWEQGSHGAVFLLLRKRLTQKKVSGTLQSQ